MRGSVKHRESTSGSGNDMQFTAVKRIICVLPDDHPEREDELEQFRTAGLGPRMVVLRRDAAEEEIHEATSRFADPEALTVVDPWAATSREFAYPCTVVIQLAGAELTKDQIGAIMDRWADTAGPKDVRLEVDERQRTMVNEVLEARAGAAGEAERDRGA